MISGVNTGPSAAAGTDGGVDSKFGGVEVPVAGFPAPAAAGLAFGSEESFSFDLKKHMAAVQYQFVFDVCLFAGGVVQHRG